MAAILGLDDDKVREACQVAAQGEVLEPANFNSPGQVVIAGNRAAVERGIEAARERGAKRGVMLPMSVPSHCSLLKPAALRLQEYLVQVPLNMPQIPVLHNATVAPAGTVEELRQVLVQQLYSPVRWTETINAFAQQGITQVLECGPGKVLAPLVKRINPGLQGTALNDKASLEGALQSTEGGK
jgi:[acyl-carrier-protein] S-malonyltransferase